MWQYVEYLVFDAPYLKQDGTSSTGSGAGGSSSLSAAAPFEARIKHAKTLLEQRTQAQEQVRTQAAASAASTPLLQGRARVVGMIACTGRKQLTGQLQEVEKGGGEGLMLRKPKSLYEHTKRSKTLLKVKSFTDEEAEVVGHQGGRGRNAYRCGALTLQTPDGRQFSCGTGMTDADRTDPPPIGSACTYRYTELMTNGYPRFPRYVRCRDQVRCGFIAPCVFVQLLILPVPCHRFPCLFLSSSPSLPLPLFRSIFWMV